MEFHYQTGTPYYFRMSTTWFKFNRSARVAVSGVLNEFIDSLQTLINICTSDLGIRKKDLG